MSILASPFSSVLPGHFVIEAIDALNRRKFKVASYHSIILYITDKYGLPRARIASAIRRCINKAVERGHLVMKEDATASRKSAIYYEKYAFPGEPPPRTLKTYTTENDEGLWNTIM
jgi:hypothetical protein